MKKEVYFLQIKQLAKIYAEVYSILYEANKCFASKEVGMTLTFRTENTLYRNPYLQFIIYGFSGCLEIDSDGDIYMPSDNRIAGQVFVKNNKIVLVIGEVACNRAYNIEVCEMDKATRKAYNLIKTINNIKIETE